MNITKQKMIKDLNVNTLICLMLPFVIVGMAIPVIPFLYLKEISKNSIISFIFLLVVFGVPFSYFIGIRRIVDVLKKKKCISLLQFEIRIDKIVGLRANSHSSVSENNFHKILLEKSNMSLPVTQKEFWGLKKGERCILIFVPKIQGPILSYPGNEYTIDKTLRHLVENDIECFEQEEPVDEGCIDGASYEQNKIYK